MAIKGFFSWLKALEDSFFESSLKMSLLWFDEIVFQSPRADMMDMFPNIFKDFGIDKITSNEISKILKPIQLYHPEYTFAEPEVWQKDQYISDATYSALTKYFEEKQGPWPNQWALNREVSLVGCGVIDALNEVSYLSKEHNCFLIPTDYEHKVITEITKPINSSYAFDFFCEVAKFRLPDFKDLSWEQILEFRHHPFLENFRETVEILHKELKSQNFDNLKDIFLEFERKSLKELLVILKPSVLNSTLKGIATNLPLPIPFNPLGIADAMNTIARDRDIIDKYGWLYFLYELS